MIKIGLVDFTPEAKVLSIFDKNDVVKAKYCIDKNDMWKHSLMSENYIEISFFLNSYVAFNRTDYILWDGDKFAIRNDYQPELLNKRKYKYTLKFEATEMFFKDIQYYYLSQGVKEAEWRLFGNPEYFIKIAVDNANRYFGVTDFKMGSIEPTKAKDIVFDVNTTIFDALTQIAEEYDAEWYVTDKIIHLVNKLEYGDEVGFETEVSVLEMKRNEGDKKEQYTRILPLGSTRNTSDNYRETEEGEGVDAVYSKRVRIPLSKGSTIDAYPNMTNDEAIEGTVIFDDIYPKRVGTIESINTIQYQDKDEETGKITKWDAYKIKDSGIDFKEEYLLPGEELRLQFVSGDLNGMDFALFFNKSGFSASDKSQNFEIVRSDDYGRPLPNATLKPSVGDQYVLYGFNIAMAGDQYVPLAEQELYDEAVKWLEKQLRDTSVYECTTAIKYFKENKLDLDLGQRVRLSLDKGSRSSRIMGFEKKLNNIYDAIYTVGDNPTYSRVSKIEQDIKELKVEGLIQGQGGNIYIIKNIDSTRPTDFNVLSSKRSLNSFHRKDITDETDYLQKFNKGAEFGEYGTKKGAYINGEGDADFENVTSKGINSNKLYSDSATMDIATINELIAKLAEVHKLEVTDTATILKSVVKEYLTSEKFVSGFAGEGFRIAQAINGDWNLEIDNLIVRKLFNVFELLVQEIKHQGGMQLYSPAGGKITKVTDGGSYWKCEIESADTFFKDDLVICQKFTGVIKRYWRAVTSVGAGYINLSKNDCETNSAIPEVGDEIAVQGNKTNTSRQSVYIVSIVGADSPYTACYSGINSYSLKDKLVTREGNLNGIIDKDFGQLKGHGLYANNAYLKGILRLTNGKTVEQELLTTNNNVEANRLELGGQIDNATAIAKSAQDKIEGLEIGGRNYFLDSDFSLNRWNRKPDFDEDMGFFYQKETYNWRVFCDHKIPSGEYILSGWFKREIGGVNPRISLTNNTSWYIESDNMPIGKWYYYSAKVSLSKEHNGRVYLLTDNKYSFCYFAKLKLEKGNKATDWTRAEEDYETELTKQITSVRTDFDVIEGQINMNVAKTEQLVNQTNGLVEETKQTATQVNQTATEINQNVSRAEESANRAETAETNINTKADSIVMEASKQSAEKAIDGVMPEIEATNSKLELLSNQFTVEVAKTDGIRTDLTRVEQGFDDYKIEVVGNINNAIDDNNEVIKSSFEMNGNKIGLLGEEIDLTGKVTFSALDSESQGKINTANDNANTANNAIGQLKTDLGDLAYEDMVSIAKLDNTIIEGGFIKTSLIEANSITADKIDVQSLEAVRIRTGNLEVLDGAMIGGFKVKNNGLTNAGFNNNAYIIMRNDPQNTFVGIGANVFDDFSGFAGNARFEIGTRRSSSDSRKNVALSLLAEGCELRENNIALNIQGGSIAGFGLKVTMWNYASDNTVKDSDSFIIDQSGNTNKIFYVPHPKNTWIGRVIIINNRGKRWLQAQIKPIQGLSNEHTFKWGFEKSENRWSLNDGQTGFMINTGSYWQCSYMDWSASQW